MRCGKKKVTAFFWREISEARSFLSKKQVLTELCPLLNTFTKTDTVRVNFPPPAFAVVKLIKLRHGYTVHAPSGRAGGVPALRLWIPVKLRYQLRVLGAGASEGRAKAVWQSECHPVGHVLSSGLPLPLTLPSGKTDDTNEGWLPVSWHRTHTHCCHCATLSPLPPGSHRRRSLRKYTNQKKKCGRVVRNSSNLGRHYRSGFKNSYYSALVAKTISC